MHIRLQAVNKLAEIMNRKEIRGGGSRRGNDTDMRRKEKENRKLQLELRSEKEKLNSAIIKYQKEINEMQAVGTVLHNNIFYQFQQLSLPATLCLAQIGSHSPVFLQQLSEESQMRIELQMALDSRDSDIEQLTNYLQSLSVPSLDSASVNSGPEFDADDAYTGGGIGRYLWSVSFVVLMIHQDR